MIVPLRWQADFTHDWIAIDFDGFIYTYERMPHCGKKGIWVVSGGRMRANGDTTRHVGCVGVEYLCTQHELFKFDPTKLLRRINDSTNIN